MLSRIFLFLSFLCLWEIAVHANWIDAFFFSSPSMVLSTILRSFLDGSFFLHTGTSLIEVIVSFLFVTILSLLSALLLWYYSDFALILEPFLVVLNSLPKSALAPLLIVWLGAGTKTIIVAGISVAIFGGIINLYTGFQATDPDQIKLIETLGGSRIDIMLKIILPSSYTLLLANMKVNIGLSLVGVVIGEFLAARKGLGYLIIYGTQVFQLDMVIASIVVLCAIAMFLYKVIQLLEKRCQKRYQ